MIYSTGREYNGKQVLKIDTPAIPEDLVADVRVKFSDESRGITGVVTIMAVELMSGTGDAVLREYDAGRYSEV